MLWITIFGLVPVSYTHLDVYKRQVLPHCWDNQKSMRFVATSGENMKMLSSYLEAIFAERSQGSDSNSARKKVDYKNFPPYYIIITDNYKKVMSHD